MVGKPTARGLLPLFVGAPRLGAVEVSAVAVVEAPQGEEADNLRPS